MDLNKLVGQQLLKISQSSQTGQHVIEFSQSSEITQQIIEIDTSKLGVYFFFIYFDYFLFLYNDEIMKQTDFQLFSSQVLAETTVIHVINSSIFLYL